MIAMDPVHMGIFVFFFGQAQASAQGNTYFFYRKKSERVTMNCHQTHDGGSTVWYMDFDFNNSVDVVVNCANENKRGNVICADEMEKMPIKKEKCKKIEEALKCGRHSLEVLNLKTLNGMIACGNSSNHHKVGTFIDFRDDANYFFLALAETQGSEVVTKPETSSESSVHVAIGNIISLPCRFDISPKNQPYIVYWLWLSMERSICIHSYGYLCGNFHNDSHCRVDRDISERVHYRSTPFPETHSHTLNITNARAPDSGRYLCVVSVLESEAKVKWAVIQNVSVLVEDVKIALPPTESPNQYFKIHHHDRIILLYTVGPLVLVAFLVTIVLVIRKKSDTSKGTYEPTFIRTQRHLEKDDTQDFECEYTLSYKKSIFGSFSRNVETDVTVFYFCRDPK
nr:PREDICTED: uncharacterized protein LOC107076895 isoform X1 [Lepisosteus oculatus]